MKGQRGQILPLALIALGLGAALSVSLLAFTGSALGISRKAERNVVADYSADAGVEHAIWRLRYEPGFADSLTEGDPTSYSMSINDMDVDMTVTLVPPPAYPPPPPPRPQAWRLCVKVNPIDPPLVPGVTNTHTFAIEVKNMGTSTIHLEEVGFWLPKSSPVHPWNGFTYLAGSSSGFTTANPSSITPVNPYWELIWPFSPPLPDIRAGETLTQSFQARGCPDGLYRFEGWVGAAPNSIGDILSGNPLFVDAIAPHYDIQASAGHSLLQANVSITDIAIRVLSWQVM